MRIEAYHKVSQLYQSNQTKSMTKTTRNYQTDKFELSKLGKEFQIANKAIAATPDIREDKVNEIKQRMATGTYTVSAEEVAKKMVTQFFDEMI